MKSIYSSKNFYYNKRFFNILKVTPGEMMQRRAMSESRALRHSSVQVYCSELCKLANAMQCNAIMQEILINFLTEDTEV